MKGLDDFGHATDQETMHILTNRAISHLRQGRPVAAFEDLLEIQNMLEQGALSHEQTDDGSEDQ